MGLGLRFVTALLILSLTNNNPALTLNWDDDWDFLDEYFAAKSQNTDRICVGRMKSCIPWENECCEGLKCTNYGGRKCDYDLEMCVCFRRQDWRS